MNSQESMNLQYKVSALITFFFKRVGENSDCIKSLCLFILIVIEVTLCDKEMMLA